MPHKYPGYRSGLDPRTRTGYRDPSYRRNAPSWNVASEFLDEFYLSDRGDGDHSFASDEFDDQFAKHQDRVDNLTLEAFVRPRRNKEAHIGDDEATSSPGNDTLNMCATPSDEAYVYSTSLNKVSTNYSAVSTACSKNRAHIARLKLQRYPTRPPSLVRQSSDPVSSSLPDAKDIQHHSLQSPNRTRSLSAPPRVGNSITPSPDNVMPQVELASDAAAALPALKSLPAAAKSAELLPAICLAATVRAPNCGEAAVEVVWRTGRDGYMVRVLPVIGASAEACVDLEDIFQRDVGIHLDEEANEDKQNDGKKGKRRFTAVTLAALTHAVDAARPSLEAALSTLAARGRNQSLRGSVLAAGSRSATGVGTASLSAFDRWLEAEAAEAATEATIHDSVAPAAVAIFGQQTCVVCAETSAIPNLSVDGLSGGAAIANCGHWTCTEVCFSISHLSALQFHVYLFHSILKIG